MKNFIEPLIVAFLIVCFACLVYLALNSLTEINKLKAPKNTEALTEHVINPVVTCYTYKDSISCVNVR